MKNGNSYCRSALGLCEFTIEGMENSLEATVTGLGFGARKGMEKEWKSKWKLPCRLKTLNPKTNVLS